MLSQSLLSRLARRTGLACPARWLRWTVPLLIGALLSGCAMTPPQRVTVYDFGPGPTTPAGGNRLAPLPPLLLAEVDAAAALEGNALLYRLAYSSAQELRPYAQARWTMAPAQLMRLRLRELLGQRRSVLAPLDAVAPGTLVLRVELEEFSHYFESASVSKGLVRIRATVSRTGPPARPVAQASFVQQRAAVSADAAGGVRALAEASDAIIAELDSWLQQVGTADASPP